MASRLRPTPESGTIAATKMPASSLGPSWAQRGSREARLAFRQAQKRGDREGAMRIAGEADKQGLASQASIGSAEERLAGQYQGREADTKVTAEIGTALTPPGPGRADGQPRSTMQEQPNIVMAGGGTSAASRFQQSQDLIGGTTPRTVQPAIPEQPPAPGASQPPENPVSGSATPQTGDASARLGQRKVNPLTGKPLGYDPRAPQGSFDEQFADSVGATSESAPQGSAEDESGFLDGVSRLTTPEGGDLTRKAAVEEMNRLRRAAGQTPADVGKSLNALLGRDRAASQERARLRIPGPVQGPNPPPLQGPGLPSMGGPVLPPLQGPRAPGRTAPGQPAPAPQSSLPFRLGQAAQSFSETNLPDAAVSAANRFASREQAGFEKVSGGIESGADAGIDHARRLGGKVALGLVNRRRRTAETLRRIREEFAAGRAGKPQR